MDNLKRLRDGIDRKNFFCQMYVRHLAAAHTYISSNIGVNIFDDDEKEREIKTKIFTFKW